MPLETATYVDSLVTSNPDGTDQRSTADDHLRLIKACLKRTFPLIAGGVSASHLAIGYVNDLSKSAQAQINTLRKGSATAFFAVQAASASYANVAGQASSASFATEAVFARSASFAIHAGTAASASYAISAGHALSASFATLATNSNQLSGFSDYARLSVNQAWTASQAITQTTATIGAATSYTPNAAVSSMFRLQLTASAALTMNAPSTPRSGQVISFHLVNGGSSTVSWNGVYQFAGGAAPSLSTGAAAVDVFAFQYDVTSSAWRQAGIGVS